KAWRGVRLFLCPPTAMNKARQSPAEKQNGTHTARDIPCHSRCYAKAQVKRKNNHGNARIGTQKYLCAINEPLFHASISQSHGRLPHFWKGLYSCRPACRRQT